MLEIIKKSKKEKSLIAIKAKYNYEALFFYTIDSNEDFYFGVEEFDFRLDGYQIRLMKDFEDLEIVNNFSSMINIKEGLIEQIKPYTINLESLQTIFQDIQSFNNIISIEREYYDDDYFFLIGKIIKADEDSLWFRDFDINGNWNKEVNIIPYDEITTIRFDSHYINTWEKYIKEEE